MSSSLVVLTVRGMVNARKEVEDTLRQLHIDKRFRATIVPDNPVYRGMLRRVKNHAAWCRADPELVKMLLLKRARKEGRRPLSDEDAKKMSYDGLESLANALAEGKAILGKLQGVKPYFALSPPRKGFKKSLRRAYTQKGLLGENPELPKTMEKML